MEITDESLLAVLRIVFNSERAMPAKFTSNGERTQSFCVEYDDLTAEDEYQLASEIYKSLWEFVGRLCKDQITESQATCMLKIGEDIAVGAFILQRTNEYASFADLRQEIIEENLNLWDQPLDQVVKLPPIQNFFDYCLWTGRARANGFRWGSLKQSTD